MSTTTQNTWTKTTCAYCGVGCGIEARPTRDGALEIRGDQSHPANFGRLCSKGLALGETIGHQGRLLHPSIAGTQCDWAQALDTVASRFTEVIAQHGPDAVAFYVSGQLLTEDYYVANKLMKGFIGSGNIDTNSRLCMSSSVAGHKRAFGADCVPGCYEDLELADLVILTGSNLAWCHPVLYQRLKAAKTARPELKVIVIDPRATPSCEIADLHLALQPGSDVALFNGLLAYLAQHQHLDPAYIADHTEGFEMALASAQRDVGDLRTLATITGIDRRQLTTFFKWFAETDKVVTVYSQGVNQSSQGTDKVNSLLNCHLATGRIGKPGCGPFSVTGQPNAMGGREVGGLANTLAAHMEFGNDTQAQLVRDFWQTDTLARSPGLKAIDLFDAIDSGRVKAVWIMATNPAVSLPDSETIQQALAKCPFVVVSDCIADTDTTRLADVLLPAQGWSEKSGTVTNSERRISRQRRLLPTPGDGKPDWWIISEVAKRMRFGHAFDYRHEADIFREYSRMTALGNTTAASPERRLLNLSGLSDLTPEQYHQLAPQQWPVLDQPASTSETPISKRLFADGQFATPSGKAQFIAVKYQPPRSQISTAYPLVLNSGRIRDQWHTMTRTGLSPRLGDHTPEPCVTLHPDDARCHHLTSGQLARITSRYGEVTARVTLSRSVRAGDVFVPIHWNQTTASAGKVCQLIGPQTDTLSGQPEFKFTPVAITPLEFFSEAIVLTHSPLAPELLSDCAYWSRQTINQGYLYRLASDTQPDALFARLTHTTNHMGRQLSFSSANGLYRHALIEKSQLKSYVLVAKSLQHHDMEWLYPLLGEPLDDSIERALISGQLEGKLAGGKTVCACKQIGKNTLCTAIREQQLTTVAEVSACTQAGTGCGSCTGEIQQLIDDIMVQSQQTG
ncbi:molybdopterin-dependent oxidoreductase [Photobacterium sp. MCCC 1A19761]|uniref:molybdopterin-dependent oxidoreductase n=1 Tax=Photobacterium sp. MCCC 1A19761 TaxID=3115000 RepID=UPI00307D3CE9